MITRTLTIISALATLLMISGCESYRDHGTINGMHVTGKVGDIMVVCDQEIWDSEIRQHLDSGLTQFILPYMPDVATFELVHRLPKKFDGSFKRNRNTLFLNIDSKHKSDKAKIEIRRDVWAHSQMVIDITAKSYDQLLLACKSAIGQVHDSFDKVEWSRLLKRYQRVPDLFIGSKLKENFGIDLALPNGSKLVAYRKNFFRIEFPKIFRPIDFGEEGVDAGGLHSGVMVYQYDYLDSSQMNLEKLLTARDTMLKYNVPSEIEGMFMGTQYVDYVYPVGEEMSTADGKINGFEVRGLYVFTGIDKMGTGGAFWGFHFVNPKTKKLVCVSGFLDAPPTTSWTQPLREIQAVLKSTKIAS